MAAKPDTNQQAAAPADEGGDGKPAIRDNRGKIPLKPARQPSEPEAEDESPAREEKSDCDDCVIVRTEGLEGAESAEVPADNPGETADAKGMGGQSGSDVLAGTLWGLFLVARPRRMPRTIIRGVTVP